MLYLALILLLLNPMGDADFYTSGMILSAFWDYWLTIHYIGTTITKGNDTYIFVEQNSFYNMFAKAVNYNYDLLQLGGILYLTLLSKIPYPFNSMLNITHFFGSYSFFDTHLLPIYTNYKIMIYYKHF